MKLQVALDGQLDAGLAVLEAVHPYIDIAEIGTPLIFREGVSAVAQVHKAYPDLLVVADLKIMDAGDYEASIAFEAGADLVTVMGVASDPTVKGAVAAAQRFGKQVVVDMIQVADLVGRGRALLDMGCDFLCVHTAFDLQSSTETPLAGLQLLRADIPDAPLAVAGGINPTTIDAIAQVEPAIVIVGGSIGNAADPAAVARVLRERMGK